MGFQVDGKQGGLPDDGAVPSLRHRQVDSADLIMVLPVLARVLF